MNNQLLEEPKTRKEKMIIFWLHFIVLFILFFFPEIVMNVGDVHHQNIPTHVYVKFMIYILVFYINYYILIDNSLNHNNAKRRLALYNVILFVVMMALCHLLWEFSSHSHPHPHPQLPPPAGEMRPPHPPHEGFHHAISVHAELSGFKWLAHYMTHFVRDAVMIILTMALSFALKMRSRLKNINHYREKLQASQHEEELNRLKSQLNPHFLFNVLNSIYVLIDVCPKKAQCAVHELSNMLRYVLYENPTTVPLKEELKFINNYIELMRLRINDESVLKVTTDIDYKMMEMDIAPLVFIAIIENVFKHGITTEKTKPIEVSISAHDGIIKCRTFNYFRVTDSAKKTSGIGLSNLTRRLKLLYGDDACLKSTTENDTFSIELTINLNNNTIKP